MKEIDDRGPEFALLSEPVKGGKHHKKLGAVGVPALLSPLLAVAAAGLITLALIADSGIGGSGGYGGGYGGGLPQAPVIQKAERPKESPEETPEETTPPPTTPPPTTPPPTTPPPTTPPPTTPPPTTPPPTTPPPVYYGPIEDDREEADTFEYPSFGVAAPRVAGDPELGWFSAYLSCTMGDAETVNAVAMLTGPDMEPVSVSIDNGGRFSDGSESLFMSAEFWGVDYGTPLTLHVSGNFSSKNKDGSVQTYTQTIVTNYD
ncbi:MAG: hypothetical protein K6F56_00910 [Oscillospiraceae bacterium]|nr:hypothetical protein [Oscillospiraceae bacterium]